MVNITPIKTTKTNNLSVVFVSQHWTITGPRPASIALSRVVV